VIANAKSVSDGRTAATVEHDRRFLVYQTHEGRTGSSNSASRFIGVWA
jgi:hypothetical protein